MSPPVLICFLIGLTDTCRLGFETCFSEKRESHYHILSQDAIFLLTVNSHVLLKFGSLQSCPLESSELKKILPNAMFCYAMNLAQAVGHTRFVCPGCDDLTTNHSSYLVFTTPSSTLGRPQCSRCYVNALETDQFRLN